MDLAIIAQSHSDVFVKVLATVLTRSQHDLLISRLQATLSGQPYRHMLELLLMLFTQDWFPRDIATSMIQVRGNLISRFSSAQTSQDYQMLLNELLERMIWVLGCHHAGSSRHQLKMRILHTLDLFKDKVEAIRISSEWISCTQCSDQIIGKARYHCQICPNVDLCQSCYRNQAQPDSHLTDHKVTCHFDVLPDKIHEWETLKEYIRAFTVHQE